MKKEGKEEKGGGGESEWDMYKAIAIQVEK